MKYDSQDKNVACNCLIEVTYEFIEQRLSQRHFVDVTISESHVNCANAEKKGRDKRREYEHARRSNNDI